MIGTKEGLSGLCCYSVSFGFNMVIIPQTYQVEVRGEREFLRQPHGPGAGSTEGRVSATGQDQEGAGSVGMHTGKAESGRGPRLGGLLR